MAKNFTLYLLPIALFLTTCSKKEATTRDLLVGEWQLKQVHEWALGGPGTWDFQPYTGDPVSIKFNRDGSMAGHARIPQSDYSVSYKIYNDSSLAFVRLDGEAMMPAKYKLNGNQLDMWLFCVENCGYRFERVQ